MGLLKRLLAAFGEETATPLIAVQELTSNAGIPYLLRPSEGDRRVAVAFAFDGGFMDDSNSEPPAALIAGPTLIEAAFGGSSSDRHDQLADLGASVSIIPQALHTNGMLSAPLETIGDAADLCRKAFDPSILTAGARDTAVEIIRDALLRSKADPNTQNEFAMLAELVEPGPQLDPSLVNPDDVSTVFIADIAAWLARHFVRSRLRIAVVGPLDDSKASSLIDTLFADLPHGSHVAVEPPFFRQRSAETRINLSSGQNEQSTLLIAASTRKPATAENYLAAQMFAFLLTGDEQSRLFRVVRDEAEASYGLSCRADVDAHTISMSVLGSIRSRDADETIANILLAVADLATLGPTPDEVRRAKSAMTQYYRKLMLQNDATAARLNDLVAAGWSIIDINDALVKIQAVDLHDQKDLLAELAEKPIVVIN